MKRPGPGLLIFGAAMKWLGIAGVGFGSLSSIVAIASFFTEARSAKRTDLMIGDINKVALALLLGSMFFILAGSGLVLISRPLIRSGAAGRPLRWPRFLAYVLYAYSAAVFGLAVILILELGGAASVGIVAGLVAYCVMVAVGLLIASWGLKHFADAG